MHTAIHVPHKLLLVALLLALFCVPFVATKVAMSSLSGQAFLAGGMGETAQVSPASEQPEAPSGAIQAAAFAAGQDFIGQKAQATVPTETVVR